MLDVQLQGCKKEWMCSGTGSAVLSWLVLGAGQEEEQAVLDDEAERRRKRVQAWQEQKAKALADEEAAAKAAAAAAAKWSFEDDDDVRGLPEKLITLFMHWDILPFLFIYWLSLDSFVHGFLQMPLKVCFGSSAWSFL